ncbi:MAG: hypothetical protein IJM73_00120, partial [Spirochaetales bacterium]|nr:hypothetical protein [Spirochaetales bacterium]
ASVCPTYYGRKNKKGSAVDMLTWQKENMVSVEKAEKMTPAELKGKLVVGILHQTQYKEFTFAYEEMIRKVFAEREKNE